MARNKKGRKEKRKVYILVEGETEQKYFDFLRQKLRLSNVKIRTLILNNSGRTWIDKAKRLLQNDPKLSRDKQTDVFVVFDKDEITVEELKAMFSKAIKEKFTIGFSNITFEVWLVAHFESMTSHLISKQSLKDKLSRYLQAKYIKANSDQLEKIIENLDVALKNSALISKVDLCGQSTNIGEMIMKIKQDQE
ncbi:RloB family protein [Ligilactobacillus murinus]|uniref:RloB family protein n=1 Tax=Ligilactobacillus murinus TaxID=1622 RepID=UPI002DD62BD1|nr:RloB family protein [Ligilactobacillus murinus]WRY37166.1 RloB family protein [Ligilactobacillus murinus]